MVIEDNRLIQGLLANLTELSRLLPGAQAQALLKSSQVMALALYQRHADPAAQLRYEAGRQLLQALAGCHGLPTEKQCALQAILDNLPEDGPATLDVRSQDASLENIRRGIWTALAGSRFPAVEGPLKDLLRRSVEWERAGYALRAPIPQAIAAEDKPAVIDAALLQNYLRSHWAGYGNATVTGLTVVAGGFSKQTVLFDVDNGGTEQFVYRGATRIQIIEPVLVDITQEFHLVSYAYSKAAPVAEPLWLQSDASVTGTRFFISRRVPGNNLGSAMQAHAPVSAAATRSLAQALARIHTLDLDAGSAVLQLTHVHPPTRATSLESVIRGRVDDWERYYRSLGTQTHPTLELAFQWLRDNVFGSDHDVPVLVHGDYGLHNILVHEDRVSAVLDWEACHVGDRALDLSHIFAGTAGSMDHELFMDAYVAAGGRRVSEYRLKFAQVLMSMQFMLSTIDAQNIFQRRPNASTNFCTLGLGFIEHTAKSVLDGVLQSSTA
jgi:aminoglycoside phosphotransferase (APT) family kinase protein